MDEWLFDEPRNVAVFTTRQVIIDKCPILFIYHDEDDGAWQFHSGDQTTIDDAMVVGLSEIVDIDPSVMQVADLPFGAMACRSTVNEPWKYKTGK